MNKTLIGALLVAAAVLVWAFVEKPWTTSRVYRIGWEDDPPEMSRGLDGQPTGFAIELVTESAHRCGIQLQWLQHNESSEAALLSGQVDLWPLMTITPERANFLHISSPYLESVDCLLVRSQSTFQRVQDLAKGAVGRRSLPISYRQAHALLPDARLVAIASPKELLEALCQQRVDAALMEQHEAITGLMSVTCGGQPLRMIPVPNARVRLGIGSTFEAAAAADRIRNEIDTMAAEGRFADLIAKWGYLAGRTESVDTLLSARRRQRWTMAAAAVFASLFVVALVLAARAVHERNRASRAEEERSRMEQQLQQAQKLDSMGRLAGGVAHDFNNLLTVINGYADLLLRELKEGDPIRPSLAEMRQAGERGAELTRQLLAFSRQQPIDPKPVDLNRLVADSETMLRRLMGEDIEVVTIPGDSLGCVIADAGQLNQMLMNLAVNARDAMPDGGKLLIETSNAELDASYAGAHPGVTPGRYVLLAVTDNGIGMDEETKQRVFEPFFTTKEAGKGTGLGLSNVYGIVKQNGGSIWAYTEQGQGTTFKIYLPRVERIAAAGQAPKPVATVLHGSETILLVEDEAAVRGLAAKVLSSYGYRVLEGSHGDEALLLAERHPEPIDLLLTDVIMPGMTGRELAERMKPSRPQMKVLYMSGYSGNAIARRGILDPGVAYIPKPFTESALASKVREVLGQPSPLGTILIVDDDEHIRKLFEQMLTAEGYRVVAAADGKEALQIVRGRSIDLVITDLVMPESEGIETIQAIRSERPTLKIIAVSGAFGGKFLGIAAKMGVSATLLKPIGRDTLVSTIRTVLG